MIDNALIKSDLLACLANNRDHQRELCRLSVSLEALIETLKRMNPKFAEIYDEQLQSPESDQARRERDGVLGLIVGAMEFLEKQ